MKYFQSNRTGNVTAVTNAALDGGGFRHLLNETVFTEISVHKIPEQFRVGGADERLNGEMIAAYEMRWYKELKND
jgi:hypothetical protein